MSSDEIDFWKRQYERQKLARKEAELLLENKSLELFRANQALKELNANLEKQLETVREKDEAREAAEQSANAKTMFLATMSHEIRTPLNGIISMNRLLMEGELHPEQRNFAETVQTSANSLLRIINDILDISKVEAGELVIEHEVFSILDKLESTFEISQFKAESKGLQFIVNYDPELPSLLVGDSTRLRQIVVNLISNAIKFTSEGRVHVEIKVTDKTAERCKLNILISDTGTGMDDDTLETVFEPFKQGDSSITRRFGGTGLGLSICTGLIDKMGGHLQCQSKPDVGSVFEVSLPFAIKGSSETKRFGSQCGTTFITSNDSLRKSALENLLKLEGLNPLVVDEPSGFFAGLNMKQRCGQCLWFIDIFGFSDSEQEEIKQQLASKPDFIVPIIIESPNTPILHGQFCYLEYSKIAFPNTRRDLTDRVCKVCNVACDSNPNTAKSPKISISNPGHFRLLLAEDNEINQIAARATLERFGFQVLIANNGKEVLEILNEEQDRVHLVLMDINMPVMDGLEACRILRAKGSRIPIVALTANAMKGDREKFIEFGMNDYLSKPLDVFLLKHVLEQRLIGVDDETFESDGPSLPPKEPAPIPSLVNMDILLPKLGNDHQLIEILLEKFDYELHKNAEAAFGYLEQNNIRQAVSSFHLLSGSAATLEIETIQKVTKSIELSLREKGDASQISNELKSFKQTIERWEHWFSMTGSKKGTNRHDET